MRLIDADRVCQGNCIECHECNIFNIYNAPTINAIPIPNNATNGDVIKALFPNATIEIIKSNVEKTMVCVTWNFKDIPSYYNRFYEAWWNAPYAKEQTNDT